AGSGSRLGDGGRGNLPDAAGLFWGRRGGSDADVAEVEHQGGAAGGVAGRGVDEAGDGEQEVGHILLVLAQLRLVGDQQVKDGLVDQRQGRGEHVNDRTKGVVVGDRLQQRRHDPVQERPDVELDVLQRNDRGRDAGDDVERLEATADRVAPIQGEDGREV